MEIPTHVPDRRDVQRARVYRAEQALEPYDVHLGDRDAAKQYTYTVLRSQAWKEMGAPRKVGLLRAPKGAARSHAQKTPRTWRGKHWSVPTVALASEMMSRITIIHELAHIAAPYGEKHGGWFVHVYLRLLDELMGAYVADKLRVSLRENNVEWVPTPRCQQLAANKDKAARRDQAQSDALGLLAQAQKILKARA